MSDAGEAPPSTHPDLDEPNREEHSVKPADDNTFGDHHSEAEVVDSPEQSSDDDTPQVVSSGEKQAFTAPANHASEDFPVDVEVLAEIIERRDMERLKSTFLGVEGFAKTVNVDIKAGVDSSTIERRREVFGTNELSKLEPVTFLEMVVDAFGDRVIQILTVAAIVSIFFGLFLPDPYTGEVERSTGWIKGVAILISVIVVTMIGAIQNYNKAKKFEEMEREQSVKSVSVRRDGREQTVTSTELVVGDVLILETGMEIVCDGLYLEGADLKTNESPITGEPDLIEKNMTKDVFLVSGTSVEEGTGVVLVAAVGMQSFQGKLKEQTQSDDTSGETPLQEHLTELGDDIGKVGLAGALGLMIALCLKEGILIAQDEKEANAASFLAFVIIAITLIAVAIPEGLPLAVTIALAFSMSAMMEQQCMVRVLASCETMGAATAVCSDKTGTLTTNEMTAVQALLAELEFIIAGYELQKRNASVKEYDRDKMQTIDTLSSIVDKFCFSLSVNSTARQQTNDEGRKVWVGNKTEAGILGMVSRLGRDYLELRDSISQDDRKQYPFSSMKKRMTTLVRRDGAVSAHTKGASETILAACTHYIDAAGDVKELTEEKRSSFNEVIVNMASQGNRTIGVATKDCDFSEFPDDEPDLPYVFMGVLGIQDPIRMEVPDAIRRCESAHLTVRMVTGDNINTAKAIGKKCGLYDEDAGHLAMTGPDFREMYRTNKEELIDLLPRLRVLARSSPTDKFVLVGLLQDEHGEVVGVTGDGTNDAPALKLADVGFAMNTGTDIAKGASDMVLIDDNFATVVTAIKWGRSVNDNIKKFLQYQLAINAAGVLLTIIGSLASEKSKEPIAPVQLLWLNLIMDTLAALSLATERPEERSLTRLPVYKQAPLITNKMRAFIGIHGVYQLTIVLLILFLGHRWFEFSESAESCKEVGGTEDGEYCKQGRVHSTFLFNVFIWFQIFNVVNARKVYGEINCFEGMWDRSKIMICVFALIIGLQVFAVEVGGDALATRGMTWQNWLISIAFGASEWLIGLIVRLLPIENYVPTKEEIVEARRQERQEEDARKAEEAEEAAKAKAAEASQKKEDSKEESTSHRESRRQSRVKFGEEHETKRRGTFVSGDSSLKRSMSIRKAHH
eukprot:CAMPEP_0174828106 /NCGR_PEP_ID=MMETSP1114-20130205/1142_1 /TAXON_ID=312471 /ORGANISM="Neobodo designis, Strain CCAP 1951/1" /LENGTH=1132 /DNA_ID=CAMNT_0016061815 /DNA_START=46 /DNA_END=3444 /DNA_ORIENTATION=-